MAIINKELRGGQLLLVGSATDTYNLVIPTLINTGLPHYLDNQVIEECYINCDTTNFGCEIILPPISAFKGSWGAKFYINQLGANPVKINSGALGDKINGFLTWNTLSNGESDYLHVVDYSLWANFVAPGI